MLAKNTCKKQTIHQPTRHVKSPQRWRQRKTSDTNTTSEERYPNRVDNCKPQFDPLGEERECFPNRRINKVQQIQQNNGPTFITKQIVPNTTSRTLGQICSARPAHNKIPYTIQTIARHLKKQNLKRIHVFWPRVLLASPVHVTLISEMQFVRINWMIARNDPLAAITVLHC